jgi:hypothetical protein
MDSPWRPSGFPDFHAGATIPTTVVCVDIFGSKFVPTQAMSFPRFVVRILLYRVDLIIRICADEEMFWIKTRSVVTAMQHPQFTFQIEAQPKVSS